MLLKIMLSVFPLQGGRFHFNTSEKPPSTDVNIVFSFFQGNLFFVYSYFYPHLVWYSGENK